MISLESMTKVNIAEAKALLSSLVDRAESGETVVICRRNIPVAELRPLPLERTAQRRVGIDRGMKIPDSFFEPLPVELIESFEGGAAEGSRRSS